MFQVWQTQDGAIRENVGYAREVEIAQVFQNHIPLLGKLYLARKLEWFTILEILMFVARMLMVNLVS